MTWIDLGDGIWQSDCGTFLINMEGGTRRPLPVTLQRTDGLPIKTYSGWWPFCPCSSWDVAVLAASHQPARMALMIAVCDPSFPQENRAYYPKGYLP